MNIEYLITIGVVFLAYIAGYARGAYSQASSSALDDAIRKTEDFYKTLFFAVAIMIDRTLSPSICFH